MKMISKIRNIIVIAGLVVAILMPLIFSCFKNVEPLNGVSNTADISELTLSGKTAAADTAATTLSPNFLDGSAQSVLEDYVTENIPGRAPMIRLRNQAIYSVFDKSTNDKTLLLKDGYIFEKSFLYRYEKLLGPTPESDIRAQLDYLDALQDELEARGKKLFIFITPSKPRYTEAKVTDIYKESGYYKNLEGGYESLTRILADYDFNVFDGIAYINNLIITEDPAAQFPLFQPTGTHWCATIAQKTALAFADYMHEVGGYEFPMAEQFIVPTPDPIFPDADIYDAMNILRPAKGNYFSSNLIVTEDIDPSLKANALMRGCSFMGQSLASLIAAGFFNDETYMENTMCRTNKLADINYFNDYSEIDLESYLDKADMVIIEINEAHVHDIGMRMPKYIMEHKEVLK